MKRLLIILLSLSVLPTAAAADECGASQELDRYRMLRRLSLDLRLRLPDYEEYTALDQFSEVPADMIDDMLASEDFRLAMRRYHEDMLWPNVNNVAIVDVMTVITPISKTGPMKEIWAVRGTGRKKTWRQGAGNETCGDWEQTEFEADGMPKTITADNNGIEYQQDGWVLVDTYWGETIKVCAFDAQTADVGVKGPCTDRRANSDRGCGCGPNLNRCFGPTTGRTILTQVREQLLLLIDDSTVGDRGYSEILTTQRTYMNGPIAHWKKHLAPMVNLNKTLNQTGPGDVDVSGAIPAFTDMGWSAADRSGVHAGILTLPAYTLRFQTNRGRANRMRIAFTGQYFVPPAGGDADCDPDADDLTQRCTCRHCHQVLEPLAAHFAPIVEAGSSILNSAELPVYNPKCDPTKSGKTAFLCNRFYVTDPDAYNPGTLLAHQYADIDDPLHNKLAENIDGGPSAWASTVIDSGQFHSTTVRTLFQHLMGREMVLDPLRSDNEIALLMLLAAEFQLSDDFRALVKSLVELPQYRRVR